MMYLLGVLLYGMGMVWPVVAGAVDLVSPREGAVYEVGSSLLVRAEAGPGEKLVGMSIGFQQVLADPSGQFVEYKDNLSKKSPLGKRTFKFPVAYTVDGEMKRTEITRGVTVVLPSTTVLQGIRLRDDQKKMFMTVGETSNLYLYGKFSDGVERNIAVGFNGTTSQSTDEKVAIFNEKGKIVGLSVGKAIVTIKNGSHEIKVPVFVEKSLGSP